MILRNIVYWVFQMGFAGIAVGAAMVCISTHDASTKSSLGVISFVF